MRYALCTLRSSEHIDGNEAEKVTSRFAWVALESNFQFLVLAVDPFGGAKARHFKVGKKVPLRVNPEPLGFTRGLEFVERQAQVFGSASSASFKQSRAKSRDRPGSRRVDFLSNQAYKIPIMIARYR
jgi:hypothetical protein